MIRYAAEKYGRDHVAQIITFGTIKARNAVRDAARVLGYPYGVGDKIAKAMPPLVMGRDTPLKYCFEQNPKYLDGYKAASELRAMCDADPDVKRVVDVAKGLEGLKRSDGIHAAAVVITKEPLTNYLPIQRKPEAGGRPEAATSWRASRTPSSSAGTSRLDRSRWTSATETAWRSSARTAAARRRCSVRSSGSCPLPAGRCTSARRLALACSSRIARCSSGKSLY